jgi:hypothetical protein
VNSPQNSVIEIATVRIELVDSKPLIWREIDIPTSITLKTLSRIVQAAMGWLNYHLWEFTIANRRYGEPSDEDFGDEPLRDAARVRLRQLLDPVETSIGYLYDFGDGWRHRLTVTKIRPGDPALLHPRYVAGARNAPPEDSGGIWGFYEKLEARADRRRLGHKEIKQWLGDYDPNVVDEMAIKLELKSIAGQLFSARRRRRADMAT